MNRGELQTLARQLGRGGDAAVVVSVQFNRSRRHRCGSRHCGCPLLRTRVRAATQVGARVAELPPFSAVCPPKQKGRVAVSHAPESQKRSRNDVRKER